MADYSFCTGKTLNNKLCPVRTTCARYLGISNDYWQGYIIPSNDDIVATGCSNYWNTSKDLVPFDIEEKE